MKRIRLNVLVLVLVSVMALCGILLSPPAVDASDIRSLQLARGSKGSDDSKFIQPTGVSGHLLGNVHLTAWQNRVERLGAPVGWGQNQVIQTSTPTVTTSASQCIRTASGDGNACFVTSTGRLSGLTNLALSSISTPPPEGLTFPFGLFFFAISEVSPNQTVTATITLSSSLPSGAFSYWKFQGGNWIGLSSAQASLDSTRTIITLIFIASGGTIVDPGGPAITPSTATAESSATAITSTTSSSETSISLISTSTSQVGTTLSVLVNPMILVAFGLVVVVVLIGVFSTLTKRGPKRLTRRPPVPSISPPEPERRISPETAEKLRRLRRMLDLGLITQDDYGEQKKRLDAGSS
jgi:hypothetical protein